MSLNNPDSTDDTENRVTVIRMEDDPELTRPVIEKRLRLAEEIAGLPKGGGANFDDSAYAAIAAITNGNPGLTLEVAKKVINKVQTERPQLPFVVTGADVESLGITREALEANWDNPMRNAHVINMKPWWEE